MKRILEVHRLAAAGARCTAAVDALESGGRIQVARWVTRDRRRQLLTATLNGRTGMQRNAVLRFVPVSDAFSFYERLETRYLRKKVETRSAIFRSIDVQTLSMPETAPTRRRVAPRTLATAAATAIHRILPRLQRLYRPGHILPPAEFRAMCAFLCSGHAGCLRIILGTLRSRAPIVAHVGDSFKTSCSVDERL
ncbi:hypothetical protein AWB76_07612 [Caballeronia temeraria]|uniref:Uncharacterized protein n=1 Tax=Caballeronia temeraria TaxID=1777137 RepID=A0A158DYZ8_9BURK|nr:hypothetical protein AWB76_07612 [Caballeronia temeraria]